MEPSSLLNLAKSQGPVFWVAAVAIALGATLLVLACAQYLRRLLQGRLRTIGQVRVVTPPAAPVAETYEPTMPPVTTPAPLPAPAPAPVPMADTGADHSLALLLRRLQSAGDRLEEIAGDLKSDQTDRDDSALKDTLDEVEYVFRASGP